MKNDKEERKGRKDVRKENCKKKNKKMENV